MATRVAIVGATAWGLTLAQLCATAGADVALLTRDEDEAARARRDRTIPARIRSVRLPDAVRISASPDAALAGAAVVVFAVPSQAMAANVRRVAGAIPAGAIVVSAAKGIELTSGRRMSQVIAAELATAHPICALSGPNLAEEIARGLPATTVVAGEDAAARAVQAVLATPNFRVYTHDDVVGVELGGALKNVIALGAGMGDGLGYGDNAKAALITRGLAEITRLGVAMGANPLTFAGLTGLGDVIATCASPLSRNRRVGEELGRGRPLSAILHDLNHVAEGVATTAAACDLAAELNVEMPVADGLNRVLRGEISPAAGARQLMEREPRGELDA